MNDTPTVRTGDTIVIGEDGIGRNVDQEAREAAAKAAEVEAKRSPRKPAPAADEDPA